MEIETIRKIIYDLYNDYENNKPSGFMTDSEKNYNWGMYQGRLNAIENLTQKLLGINGDELFKMYE